MILFGIQDSFSAIKYTSKLYRCQVIAVLFNFEDGRAAIFKYVLRLNSMFDSFNLRYYVCDLFSSCFIHFIFLHSFCCLLLLIILIFEYFYL